MIRILYYIIHLVEGRLEGESVVDSDEGDENGNGLGGDGPLAGETLRNQWVTVINTVNSKRNSIFILME